MPKTPIFQPIDIKDAAFYLSVALAITDRLKSIEKPKSARYLRLNNLEDQILKITDMYRPEAWTHDDMKKAVDVFDHLVKDVESTILKQEAT